MTSAVLTLTVPLMLAVATQAPGRGGGAQQPRDYQTFDVCQAVPGETIARALGGKLVQARPFHDKSFGRCTYFVIPQGADKQLGYAVWMSPPQDFEELKKHIEEPRTTLTGLGDGAYMFQDKGDGRFKVYVLKRGDLMFQATAESAESARKVAAAVVARLWNAAP
jgi:hypothetical protein